MNQAPGCGPKEVGPRPNKKSHEIAAFELNRGEARELSAAAAEGMAGMTLPGSPRGVTRTLAAIEAERRSKLSSPRRTTEAVVEIDTSGAKGPRLKWEVATLTQRSVQREQQPEAWGDVQDACQHKGAWR